jgi:thiamine biosynthesis lipoprotein
MTRPKQLRALNGRAARRALLFAALLAIFATTANCRDLQGEGLGSTWKVTIADRASVAPAALNRGIQQQIDSVTHQLSRWDKTSSLNVLNATPDDEWHALPTELFTALSYALVLAESTKGAYDPTVAPLVDVWGFGTHGRQYQPPTAMEISAAQARVGSSKVALDASGQRARRPNGVQLDLSSMTHGLAADQVAAYLRSVGVTRYLVDVGSELRAQGDNPEGHPWRVAIERPPPDLSPPDLSPLDSLSAARRLRASSSSGLPASTSSASSEAPIEPPLHVIALRNAGIATSGNYRYFFDYNGRRYSHRIDPRTGAPIDNSLASVTVIAPECMHADALATALTVLGPDDGLEYARSHNIAALFILRTAAGLEERMTPEFAPYLN